MSSPGPITSAVPAEAWIRRQRVIAILRLENAEHVVQICQTLVDQGVTVMEVTADQPHASASIRRVRQKLGRDVLLGAGTVLDAQTVESVAAAGADFCVAPNLDPGVVAACAKFGMLAIPGVFTPTEVAAARRLGLRLLKLFPCGGLSPEFLAALRGPFPSVGFVPTGGIDLTNASDWLRAGAAAVGLGSALVGRDGSLHDLVGRAQRLKACIADPGGPGGHEHGARTGGL
ncbi:MAG TPA: bifunctional 4-hydroxy-2-oxoglutarate aldolase/2-dehydro-3-deoxy-phosphogluconate aldolase [Streptosporangiaceae bacterium]|nr:bifunctional 4-hydroxy-2-oxoglutarate aldolase/2-dehydro-3-deoxy-phosphogluconate aldolase [Streptosporangiaceae bacterium]